VHESKQPVSGRAADAPAAAPFGLVPSVDQSPAMRLLPVVLSLVAGSCDIISFISIGGLFTAHITGNLVVLAARIVGGASAPLSFMISVPVFIVALGLARLLAGGLDRLGIASLRPLLGLQFALLCGFLVIGVANGPRIDPNAGAAIFAGMLGVSAMAVQNALVQISLRGAPTTAVMTTNVTRLVMDVGEVLLGRDPAEIAKAGSRARHTAAAVIGFAVGGVIGAACEMAAGAWSLALPTILALVALALSLMTTHEVATAS
jgi:uncharacterized membrane protein YoaK (UPF0700 family)